MKIVIKNHGDFHKTEQYLLKAQHPVTEKQLEKLGDKALQMLKDATPKNSMITADSWTYIIGKNSLGPYIEFDNTNIQNGKNIALLIDQGHATKSGHWVSGKNYIAPAIQDIYEMIMRKTEEELKAYGKS